MLIILYMFLYINTYNQSVSIINQSLSFIIIVNNWINHCKPSIGWLRSFAKGGYHYMLYIVHDYIDTIYIDHSSRPPKFLDCIGLYLAVILHHRPYITIAWTCFEMFLITAYMDHVGILLLVINPHKDHHLSMASMVNNSMVPKIFTSFTWSSMIYIIIYHSLLTILELPNNINMLKRPWTMIKSKLSISHS